MSRAPIIAAAIAAYQRGEIKPHEPLRLDVAAAIAYPLGEMTVSGLRRQASKGRLVIERTSRKDYTTLAAIERMRELCRVSQPDLTFGFDPPASADPGSASLTKPAGSLSTESISKALAAFATTAQELKERFSSTSGRNT